MPWSFSPLTARLAGKMLVVAVTVAALGCLARPLLELPVQIGRNDNEGWNAYKAAALLEGEPLYRDLNELVSTTYPPLSFAITAGISTLTGDTLRTGRLLSLLSLLVVALSSAWIARSISSSRGAAYFSGVLVVGSMGAHYQNYVAMNDPQMLGHALQYLGLALLLSHLHRRRFVLICLLLLVAGGLVKHNLYPVPLGITLWIWTSRKQDFLFWLSGSAALVFVSVLLLFAFFGVGVFTGMLSHPRPYALALLPLALERWFVPIAPLMAVGLSAVMFRKRDPRTNLILVIGALSLLSSILSSVGRGMNYNAVFDLLFSVCILAGVVVAETVFSVAKPDRVSMPWLHTAVALAACSTILMVAPRRAFIAYEVFERLPAEVRVAQEDLELARAQPGPAMCEDPSVCYWSGKKFDVDFFNLSQKLRAGTMDGSELAARIEAREFGVIQLAREGHSDSLSPEMNRAIAENYQLSRSSNVNGYFYVPKNTATEP